MDNLKEGWYWVRPWDGKWHTSYYHEDGYFTVTDKSPKELPETYKMIGPRVQFDIWEMVEYAVEYAVESVGIEGRPTSLTLPGNTK